jgi:hypothetical protein
MKYFVAVSALWCCPLQYNLANSLEGGVSTPESMDEDMDIGSRHTMVPS